jgi:AraC family transcriptional regulator
MNEDYIKRINRVLEYIDENLQSDLSLETISAIAFYSPFHLHRLFKAITNETPNAYIMRKRIERAAMQLIHKKELTISEIAFQNGFNSNSSFTRAFNKIYGHSPTDFRRTNANNNSKIGKTDSKKGQSSILSEEYFCNINHLKNWIHMNAKIEIKEMPKMKVAYTTHIGVNGVEKAFDRIIKWAMPKGLLNGKSNYIVRVFHDSFKVTDENKVRMSVGVVLNDETKAEGEIGLTTIGEGNYLTGRFEIVPHEFEKSWNGLYIWMGENGFSKAAGNPFEIYHNNPEEHPQKKCIVDLCIPVE